MANEVTNYWLLAARGGPNTPVGNTTVTRGKISWRGDWVPCRD